MVTIHEIDYDKTGLPYVVSADPLQLLKPKTVRVKGRLCPCGCHRPLTNKQRWATQACKQKAYRYRRVQSLTMPVTVTAPIPPSDFTEQISAI